MRTIMNDEKGRMGKEVVMDCSKVLKRLRKKHENISQNSWPLG